MLHVAGTRALENHYSDVARSSTASRPSMHSRGCPAGQRTTHHLVAGQVLAKDIADVDVAFLSTLCSNLLGRSILAASSGPAFRIDVCLAQCSPMAYSSLETQTRTVKGEESAIKQRNTDCEAEAAAHHILGFLTTPNPTPESAAGTGRFVSPAEAAEELHSGRVWI